MKKLKLSSAGLLLKAGGRRSCSILYAAVSAFGLIVTAPAQTPTSSSVCAGAYPLGAGLMGMSCANASPDFANYSKQSFYVPDAVKDPVLTFNISLHIIVPSNSSQASQYGTFIDDSNPLTWNGRATLNNFLSSVTEGHADRFSDPKKFLHGTTDVTSSMSFPSGSYVTSANTTLNYNSYVNDSKIQYHVTGIHFYVSDYHYFSNTNDDCGLMNFILQQNPHAFDDGFPIIQPGEAWTNGTYYSGCGTQGFVISNATAWDQTFFTTNLLHEIGHAFGLMHCYYGGGGWHSATNFSYAMAPESINGSNGTLNCSDPDFLKDMFPISNPYCPTAGAAPAYNPPTTCACYEADPMSNNIMGGIPGHWMSPLQMGRRLRKLHMASSGADLRQYVADMASNHAYPWEINTDQKWDFDIQMYHDIVVKAGHTLTLTCNVLMPLEGRIKVEKGAQLILDGGTISTWCKSDFWAGVYLEGTSTIANSIGNIAGGYNTNHGIIRIKNGGKISHAEGATHNYALDQSGNVNWSSIGGMIKADHAVFENNWRDVEMLSFPYQSNGSYFQFCDFTTTGALIPSNPSYGPESHVTLWNVRAINFFACDFDRATPLYSSARKSGIASLDASFVVDNGTGAVQSTFTGLDYGVSCLNTNPLLVPSVRNALFTDINVDGVHMDGINNVLLEGNKFTSSAATLNWGIYMNSCKNYMVKNNSFEKPASTGSSPGNVGIGVFNSQAGAHEIYRNDFKNLYAGIVAYGNNSGQSNLTDGLRMNCDRFNQSSSNLYDISLMYDGATPPTVRWAQGDYSGAGSQLTQLVRNAYAAVGSDENQFNIQGTSIRPVTHNCSPDLFCKPSPRDGALTILALAAWPHYDYSAQCPTYPNSTGGSGTAGQRLVSLNSFITSMQGQNSAGKFTQDIKTAVGSKIYYFMTDTTVINPDSVISIYQHAQGKMDDADVLSVYALMNKGNYSGASAAVTGISSGNDEWKPLLNKLIDFAQNPTKTYNLSQDPTSIAFFEDYVTNNKKGNIAARSILQRYAGRTYTLPRSLPGQSAPGSRMAEPMAVAEMNENAGITVYPNPASNVVFVDYKNQENKTIDVIMSDAMGKLVYSGKVKANERLEIPMNDLNNGIYLVKAFDGKQTLFQTKVICIK